jgi:hypothetical protein
MSKMVILALFTASVAWSAFAQQKAGSVAAQGVAQKSSAPAAPVPPLIGAAKKVFIVNAGWDCASLEYVFHGAPNRVYEDFYLALKRWGRYEPVSAPSEADLDLGIGFACPPGATSVTNGDGGAQYSPKLILTISQPKGNAMIWRIVQPVKPTRSAWRRLGEYSDKDLTENVTFLVDQLKSLAVRSSIPAINSTSAP